MVDKNPALYVALKTLFTHPVIVHYHSDFATTVSIIKEIAPHLVLLDFNTHEASQNTIVQNIVYDPASVSSIFVSFSYSANISQVVMAMRRGAYGYILKSQSPRVIYDEIVGIIASHQSRPHSKTATNSQQNGICGISRFAHDLREFVVKSASHSFSILLLGESGTGKDLVAEKIHQASERSQGMFLSINCAAIPDTIIEGEIFGTESGSFTGAVERMGKFELAHGGTLFLNEVADMSWQMQAKLLSVLEKQQFMRLGGTEYIESDARIIFATNGNLKALVKEKKFREDLYYRMMTITYTMQPLRTRKEDIGNLAWYFLWKLKYKQKFFTILALEKLLKHDWPGNVRELKHCIERATINSTGEAIVHTDIQFL